MAKDSESVDLVKELESDLRDSGSELHNQVQRDLDELAAKAALEAKAKTPRRTGTTAGSIHTESGSDANGLPSAAVVVDGYRADGTANAAVANALKGAGDSKLTANVRPLIKGVFERTGTFRSAEGPWIHDSVFQTVELWREE